MPSFSDGHLLFYRKDRFEEKGIKINKKTVSIPEIKDLVEKYSNNKPVIALKSDVTEILLDFLPFLWERGVELLDQPPFFSDEKKTILALEDYLSFKPYCPQQVENYGNLQVKEAIQRGEVVIGVSWGGQAAAILNPNENPYFDQIGFMTYQYPCNTTWGFVVAANSANKDIAISYLKYISNQENDKLVGRVSGGPVRKTTYQDKNEIQFCHWYEVQYHMLINAKHVPKSVHFAKASSSLYTLLHRLFKQEITPNEMMELLKA
ncbi:extracellular solute-binding protein [Tepidibacillus infernus]|uniref:extracellular solute-binding protein n=1 Tax=Tepidibacillus TaxID=1494427 RepID=UPI0009EA2944|nr:extracellular solute-binding protein [Tepidibacillus decaturensis]